MSSEMNCFFKKSLNMEQRTEYFLLLTYWNYSLKPCHAASYKGSGR